MNLRNLLPVLLLTAFMLVACGDNQPLTDIDATPEARRVEQPRTVVSTPISTPVETTFSVAPAPTKEEQNVVFWNEPYYRDMPKCTTDFRFTHWLADPEDIAQIMFGSGSHISPHEHMAYWGVWPLGHPGRHQEQIETAPGEKRQMSEKVQLYAPTDFFYISVDKETRSTPEGKSYVEWAGSFGTCNGYQVGLGHVGDPSPELLALLDQEQMKCDGLNCRWEFNGFIPAGTQIFRSSGYTGAFDFALVLYGLTAEELRRQPSYGYSITPWRVSAGNAVCPLEYFLGPTRSDYLNLLRDGGRSGRLQECGPFNQDMPGTAMGLWFPSPSANVVPSEVRLRWVDEWETVWLHQSPNPFIQAITVGNNTFGLAYNENHYSFSTASDGLVNQRWDLIKPGPIYCTELYRNTDVIEENHVVHKILITVLSENGTELTIEALSGDECSTGPWEFQGGHRTFYR